MYHIARKPGRTLLELGSETFIQHANISSVRVYIMFHDFFSQMICPDHSLCIKRKVIDHEFSLKKAVEMSRRISRVTYQIYDILSLGNQMHTELYRSALTLLREYVKHQDIQPNTFRVSRKSSRKAILRRVASITLHVHTLTHTWK